MQLSRVLVFVILPSAGIAAAPLPQDQSVADFKAPGRTAPAAAKISSAVTTPEVQAPAVRVPPRIQFAMPRISIAREGRSYSFRFTEAPMPEIVAAIATLFHVKAIYAGSANRSVSGEFAAETIEQVVAHLVEGSNLRYSADGGVWFLRETSDAALALPVMSLATVFKPAAQPGRGVAEASATISSATADR